MKDTKQEAKWIVIIKTLKIFSIHTNPAAMLTMTKEKLLQK